MPRYSRIAIPQRVLDNLICLVFTGSLMPIRSGAEYIRRLKNESREVWFDGRQVTDICAEPAYRGIIATVAGLYDLQLQKNHQETLTFLDITGTRVGRSLSIPRTHKELSDRGEMFALWAKKTGGMLGRSPDFLNTNIAAWAAAADFFSTSRLGFGANIKNYHEYLKKNDLALTHSVSTLASSRQSSSTDTESDLRVVRESDAGFFVTGTRNLATLAPVCDEVVIYPGRISNISKKERAFCFAVPVSSQGLKIICRNSFAGPEGNFDQPLGSRFEEMDALLLFEDVFVPWERTFIYGDLVSINELHLRTNSVVHSAHQSTIKAIAKSELVVGAGILASEVYGTKESPHIQQFLAEQVAGLETMKALRHVAEATAQIDQWGVMAPALAPMEAARVIFMSMYPKMIETLKRIGASNLLLLQSEDDFVGPLQKYLEAALGTPGVSAKSRVSVNRLLWDLTGSSFGSRQALYESFYAGGESQSLQFLYKVYPEAEKNRLREYAKEFLTNDGSSRTDV